MQVESWGVAETAVKEHSNDIDLCEVEQIKGSEG